MTINEYETSVMRTWNKTPSWDMQLVNVALGLGESGEVQNLVKKLILHKRTVPIELIWDELGDVLYYVVAACQITGTSVETIMEMNRKKLEERYPGGFKEGVN